jgi:hypothetical protein
VPMVSRLTTRDPRAHALLRYHWETIVNSVPPESVMQALTDSGIRDVSCRSELDLFRCFIGRKAATRDALA